MTEQSSAIEKGGMDLRTQVISTRNTFDIPNDPKTQDHTQNGDEQASTSHLGGGPVDAGPRLVWVGVIPLPMDNIGFWNTKGLNKPKKHKEVHLFLHNAKVGLFGLLETKIKRNKATATSPNLYENWLFVTNFSHHPGGRI